jgi:hypothetical protein
VDKVRSRNDPVLVCTHDSPQRRNVRKEDFTLCDFAVSVFLGTKNPDQELNAMETVQWVNRHVPLIAGKLERAVRGGLSAGDEEGLDLAGRTGWRCG